MEAIRAAAARAQGRAARLHLKVDTGMSRGGAAPEELPALAVALRRAVDEGTVDVVGLWSHLSRADEPASGSTEEHLVRYRQAEQIVREAGLNPPLHHVAATGGLLWHPAARMDLVRVGIGLYGLSPDPSVATSAELGLRPYDVPTRRGELKYVLVTASPDDDLMVRFVLRSRHHLERLRAALPDLHRRLPQLAVAGVNIQGVHHSGDGEIGVFFEHKSEAETDLHLVDMSTGESPIPLPLGNWAGYSPEGDFLITYEENGVVKAYRPS